MKKFFRVSGTFLFFAIILFKVWGGNSSLDQIKNDVASDAVRKYEIAKRQGDEVQICVQAGMVSAAYLQAEDEEHYNMWKSIEKNDCSYMDVQP